MQSRDFCYWLQGFFEVQSMTSDDAQKPESRGLTPAQVSMIRNHLNMVFIHEIDPSMGDKPHQDKLTAAHGPFDPSKILMRC